LTNLQGLSANVRGLFGRSGVQTLCGQRVPVAWQRARVLCRQVLPLLEGLLTCVLGVLGPPCTRQQEAQVEPTASHAITIRGNRWGCGCQLFQASQGVSISLRRGDGTADLPQAARRVVLSLGTVRIVWVQFRLA